MHANFSFNAEAAGIETFCIKPSLITPVPFFTHEKNLKIPLFIDKNNADSSYLLAREVHTQVVARAAKKNKDVLDRRIKYKVAQVLLGSMPSILIELGFMSHAHEARLLNERDYQMALANGISDGILSYLTLMK